MEAIYYPAICSAAMLYNSKNTVSFEKGAETDKNRHINIGTIKT